MPQLKINGVEHTIDADPQMPLLWAIRDIVGLTGTQDQIDSLQRTRMAPKRLLNGNNAAVVTGL